MLKHNMFVVNFCFYFGGYMSLVEMSQSVRYSANSIVSELSPNDEPPKKEILLVARNLFGTFTNQVKSIKSQKRKAHDEICKTPRKKNTTHK